MPTSVQGGRALALNQALSGTPVEVFRAPAGYRFKVGKVRVGGSGAGHYQLGYDNATAPSSIDNDKTMWAGRSHIGGAAFGQQMKGHGAGRSGEGDGLFAVGVGTLSGNIDIILEKV